MSKQICYGMKIRLRHDQTGAYLKSIDRPYVHPGSSNQHMVGGAARADDSTIWLVKPSHDKRMHKIDGQALCDGDLLRLEHIQTARNLHSHSAPAPLTGPGQREVTTFMHQASGLGDYQDDWVLDLVGRVAWDSGNSCRLIHNVTKGFLHSHGIADPYKTAGMFEVTNVPAGDANDLWTVEILSRGASSGQAQDHEIILPRLFSRFNKIVKQLGTRQRGRAPFTIQDEYDVQDLLHALLREHYDDVRAEEWTPSYAAGSSRIDFILKAHRVAIEVKKTRPGMKASELADELIIDKERYRAHPDCETLFCFVYDPDGIIQNPAGIEADLESKSGPRTLVFIFPKL